MDRRRQVRSREVDLEVVSIEMVVEFMFVDRIIQRQGVEGDEKRTKE